MKNLVAGLSFAILALSGPTMVAAQAPPQAQPMQQASPCGPRVTPPEQIIYDRTMRHFASLDLTPQQQGQIKALIAQYSQAHPGGSPLDVAANRELHESILGILTPQQRDALQQEMDQRRRDDMPQHRPCPPRP